ncbi:BQ5605_C004g03113 [Microbotryum silenes-dioicae]|uniref:BQ5605_C004g03113 protein n=1 Tax=Microbotryum silenes-dioicae TaxID=796604 RepID=A0A2X0M9W1_9BASI|nr:BQ5605_C004g03113 [Microbotryum silenes-dioicae]
MSSSEQNMHMCPDAFKIARLRFLRSPPAVIAVPELTTPRTPCLLPIELLVGITDDYGVHIDAFASLELRLRVVDCDDLLSSPIKHVELQVNGSDHGHYVFDTSRGNYHKVVASLRIAQSPEVLPKAVRFELSVARTKAPPDKLSRVSQRILEIIGEGEQIVLEGWQGQRYIFMSSLSGDVELKQGRSLPNDPGKVQTNLRRIHTDLEQVISIVERPGLNNSTGQRLWDCAIGLCGFLSSRPDALYPSQPLPEAAESSTNDRAADWGPAAKRSQRVPPRLVVIELGAGCALASLFAAVLLDKLKPNGSMTAARARVVATDVKETVSTTLRENLDYNHLLKHIDAKVLRWGSLDTSSLDSFIGNDGEDTDLTLLGTDVLYNPESHQALLDTLTSFLNRPLSAGGGHQRAIIAYKARTEGDEHFFQLARDVPGLQVTLVWRWGDVSVWSFHAAASSSVVGS